MSGTFETLYYAKASQPAKIKAAVENIRKLAEEFANNYGITLGLEEAVLVDVVRLYSRDIDKMALDKVYPNAYRQAASLCIWLARLKPIVAVSFDNFPNAVNERMLQAKSQINEVFALFAASAILLADRLNLRRRPGLDDLIHGLWNPTYEDLLTVLRYRVVSRHAVAIILQTICEQGLKPASQ